MKPKFQKLRRQNNGTFDGKLAVIMKKGNLTFPMTAKPETYKAAFCFSISLTV